MEIRGEIPEGLSTVLNEFCEATGLTKITAVNYCLLNSADLLAEKTALIKHQGKQSDPVIELIVRSLQNKPLNQQEIALCSAQSGLSVELLSEISRCLTDRFRSTVSNG